jgi:membrane protease YdiL (CAAX protease family)
VWAAWHGPLFLMDGYYERFGEAPNPVHFTYDIVLTTLLITWIFNHTGRSVLAAILFHFMVNFSEEIVSGSPDGDLVASALTTAVVAVLLWRGALQRRG